MLAGSFLTMLLKWRLLRHRRNVLVWSIGIRFWWIAGWAGGGGSIEYLKTRARGGRTFFVHYQFLAPSHCVASGKRSYHIAFCYPD